MISLCFKIVGLRFISKMSGLFVTIMVLLLECSNAYCIDNHQSIQRGKILFDGYCAGCHTLRYGDHPVVSLPKVEGLRWFGKTPPDLSLSARERGKDWLIAYLKGFYPDKHRPFGSNNRLLPDVQMPNVLENVSEANDKAAFQQTVTDLVDYLVYVAEPNKDLRYKIGYGVLLFLTILFILFMAIYSYSTKDR